MKKELEILVCNDDGITAPGIFHLIQAVQEFGNITVVAPDSPQSGMGHAISVGKPLRLSKTRLEDKREGWACSGTPVDCVKLATGVLLKHKPDLIVSGINHGANSSINIFYSGTMSAAIEGAIEGIPSIGFSLLNWEMNADFSASQEIVKTIIRKFLDNPFPNHVALNVNIPDLPIEKIKGIKITRQAQGRWVEEFDKRTDPHGRDYYWLTGKFRLDEDGEDTDIWALENGYVSICPVEIDATAHHAIPAFNTWRFPHHFDTYEQER
jgi:5'-nucleotidase